MSYVRRPERRFWLPIQPPICWEVRAAPARPGDEADGRKHSDGWGIQLLKSWSDEHLVELRVTVADGASRFVNRVYVGHGELAATISALEKFKGAIHGGLCDVRFGEFGCEYANGAFHARLHYPEPGRLRITCRQETDFEEFGKKTVASCATLYIRSEPALLDRFIVEMKTLAAGADDEASLEAV